MTQRKDIEGELAHVAKVQGEMDKSRLGFHEAYLESKADLQRLGRSSFSDPAPERILYWLADGGALLQEGAEDSLAQQMLQPQPPTGHSKSTGAGPVLSGCWR